MFNTVLINSVTILIMFTSSVFFNSERLFMRLAVSYFLCGNVQHKPPHEIDQVLNGTLLIPCFIASILISIFWSGFRKEILFSCMSSFAPINDDLFEITSTRRVWLFLKWREKNGCCGQNSIIRGWCYHIKNRWFDTMDRRTCFHSKRLTYSCFWFWQCIFSVDKSLSFFFFFRS